MPLDDIDKDLLAAARTAGERFEAAEREADMARGDYHHAVRRLHLAGASLRDVGEALGISHQRVQQIVQAAGGTWWSFIWRGRKVKPDMICSFCGLPSSRVAKLIAGPNVYICDACVAAGETVLRSNTSKESAGGARVEPVPFSSKVRCSFCRKKPRQTVLMVEKTKSNLDLRLVCSGDKRVCERCLDICRRILDDRSHAASPAGTHA
jgi:hypothetical protein